MINCLGIVFYFMYCIINYVNKFNFIGIFGMNKENYYVRILILVLSLFDLKV